MGNLMESTIADPVAEGMPLRFVGGTDPYLDVHSKCPCQSQVSRVWLCRRPRSSIWKAVEVDVPLRLGDHQPVDRIRQTAARVGGGARALRNQKQGAKPEELRVFKKPMRDKSLRMKCPPPTAADDSRHSANSSNFRVRSGVPSSSPAPTAGI